MAGSKEFGPGKDFPQKSPSAGKPILQTNAVGVTRFTDLLDTFLSYFGKAGRAVIVNATGTGLTTTDSAVVNDKNYVHTQLASSTIWTVTHNLAKYPSVRIKGSNGHSIIGDIVDVSINQLTIEFTSAQTGIAILN